MEKVENYKQNKFLNILKGCLISICTTIILFLIFGGILSFTNVSEDTINPVIIIITAISILLGSSITCRRIEKKGLITGGIIGVIYISLLYMTSSILSGNFGINLYAIIMIICSIFAGMFGGVIGVNLK